MPQECKQTLKIEQQIYNSFRSPFLKYKIIFEICQPELISTSLFWSLVAKKCCLEIARFNPQKMKGRDIVKKKRGERKKKKHKLAEFLSSSRDLCKAGNHQRNPETHAHGI